ncbi:MAG: LOG family protein [Candidatus Poribacteria bacterium]
MENREKIVAVFGSSRARSDNETYNKAYETGKLLAEAGFIVCNGGYSGVMEASAKGAKQANGKTIGITTDAFKELSVNKWIDQEIKTGSYIERLQKIVETANAFIVLKGGIGTLSELSIIWCSNVIREIRKPVVLVGDSWEKVIKEMTKRLIISPQEMLAITMVREPKSAVEILKRMLY